MLKIFKPKAICDVCSKNIYVKLNTRGNFILCKSHFSLLKNQTIILLYTFKFTSNDERAAVLEDKRQKLLKLRNIPLLQKFSYLDDGNNIYTITEVYTIEKFKEVIEEELAPILNE